MRRRRADRREPAGDPKYSNRLVAKFISNLMMDGKKTVAEGIVYEALKILEQKIPDNNGSKIFNKAIDNVRPKLEVKARRVGGATYQVPIEVPVGRRHAPGMRWVRRFGRKKKGRAKEKKLAD